MLIPSRPLLALALLVGCSDEPYQLTLALHFPGGAEGLVDDAGLAVVATDDAGVQTLFPLGTGAGAYSEVPSLPSNTVRVGVAAEDLGGDDTAVDFDQLLAYGDAALDGGLVPGATASVDIFVAPFGQVVTLDEQAPRSRVVGGALAVTSDSRVFVFGGQFPGGLFRPELNDEVLSLSLDAGETKLAGVGERLPKTVAVLPVEIDPSGEVEYTGRVGLSATIVDVEGAEKILVVGGHPSIDFQFGPTDQFFVFDPATITLDPQKMETPRSLHLAVPFSNGNVLVYGGFVDGNFPRPSHSVWSERKGVEEEVESGDTGAVHMAGAQLDEDVVVCGGDLGSSAAGNQVWSPNAGCVRVRPTGELLDFDPLPEPLSALAMVALGDGSLLASGGFTEDAVDLIDGGSVLEFGVAPGTNSAYRWTPSRGWQPVGALKRARCGHQMQPLADGGAIVFGGDTQCAGVIGEMTDPVDCAERFDPATDSFTLLECGLAWSGVNPMTAMSRTGDMVSMQGMVLSTDADTVDGGLALAASSRGPDPEPQGR